MAVGDATRVGGTNVALGGIDSSGGNLYGYYGFSQALYTLNTTNGSATRVSTSTGRGPFSRGLVVRNGVFYTVATADYLLSINTSTGVASRVGSSSRFGVGESNMGYMALVNNNLLAYGYSTRRYYTIDVSTGAATVAIAQSANVAPSSMCWHDGRVFATGFQGDGENLYTVNLSTGALTKHGDASANFGGIASVNPQGLASHSGVLYMYEGNSNALYTLEVAPAATSNIYLGDDRITKMYIGSDEVTAAYLGTDKVF